MAGPVMRHWTRIVLASVCLGLASLGAATAASAQAPSLPVEFTNVKIEAVGGDAIAVAGCTNGGGILAILPKQQLLQQVNQCQAWIAAGSIVRQGANVLVRNIVLHGVNALVYKTWDKEIGRGTGVPQRFNNVVLTVKSGVTPPGTQCVLREGCDPTEVGGTFTLIDADIKIDKVG